MLRWGSGSKLLIAWHGYGDQATQFAPLASSLGERYTIYSVDLPYHGKTVWNAPYHPSDLVQLVEWIMQKEAVESCGLLGFSFGGRLALCLWPLLAERLEALYLLAPDGLETKASRGISWLPMAGRRLLINSLQNPAWFLKLVDRLHRVGLVASFPKRFLDHHLSDDQRRARLFYTWLIVDNFSLQKKKLLVALRESSIPVVLCFGEKDEIVPARVGTSMAAAGPMVNLQLLPSGHRQLVRHFAEWWEEQK